MYAQIISLTLIQGLGLTVSVIFLILISFSVPQSEIGVYANLLAFLNIGVALGGMGFEKILVRDFKTQNGHDYLLLNTVVFVQISAAIVIGVAGVLISPILSGVVALVFIIALSVTVVNRSYQRALRLLGWPKLSLSIDAVMIRGGLLLLGIYIWWYGDLFDGTSIFIVFGIFSGLALLVYIYAFRSKKSGDTPTLIAPNLSTIFESLNMAKYFWFNNVVSVVTKEIDTIVAFYLLGGSEAASLFFGRRLYNILSIINEGAAFRFEQDFSIKTDHIEGLKDLFDNLRLKVVVLSLGLFLILGIGIYLAEFKFRAIENVFYIGLVFMLVRVIENGIGPVFLYLNMRGKEFYVFNVVTVFLLLKLSFFFLVPNISVLDMAIISGASILGAALFCLQQVNYN